MDVLTERGYFTPDLSAVHASESLLSTLDVDQMPSEALLWQTGYLTFRGQRQTGARIEYTLTEPNLEVRSALHDALLKRLMGESMRAERAESRLFDRLSANDFSGLQAHFSQLFASIPHDWYRINPLAQYEGYYASVFYSHFAALGLDITLEDASNHGRLDMAVRFNRQIYLFAFKVVELTPEGKALQQIKDKGYADKYRAEGHPIHLIGVEFSREQRSVVGFAVESLISPRLCDHDAASPR